VAGQLDFEGAAIRKPDTAAPPQGKLQQLAPLFLALSALIGTFVVCDIFLTSQYFQRRLASAIVSEIVSGGVCETSRRWLAGLDTVESKMAKEGISSTGKGTARGAGGKGVIPRGAEFRWITLTLVGGEQAKLFE